MHPVQLLANSQRPCVTSMPWGEVSWHLKTQKKKEQTLQVSVGPVLPVAWRTVSQELRAQKVGLACRPPRVLPCPSRVEQWLKVLPASVSQCGLVLAAMTCALAFASLPSLPPQHGVLGHNPSCATDLWGRCYKGGLSTYPGFDSWLRLDGVQHWVHFSILLSLSFHIC